MCKWIVIYLEGKITNSLPHFIMRLMPKSDTSSRNYQSFTLGVFASNAFQRNENWACNTSQLQRILTELAPSRRGTQLLY